MKENWSLSDFPVWVQKGGMSKKQFPKIMKEKNTEKYIELCMNTKTLKLVVEMLYETKLENLETIIEDKVKNEDATDLRKLVDQKERLEKEYAFLKPIYEQNEVITKFGFDYYDVFNQYIKELNDSILNNVKLEKTPSYKMMQPVFEYVGVVYYNLYYIKQIEAHYQTKRQTILNNDKLQDYEKSHLLDKEEFWYYTVNKKIKREWGATSSALVRSMNGYPLIEVKDKEFEPLNNSVESSKFYKNALQKIVDVKTQVRQTEINLYQQKESLEQ